MLRDYAGRPRELMLFPRQILKANMSPTPNAALERENIGNANMQRRPPLLLLHLPTDQTHKINARITADKQRSPLFRPMGFILEAVHHDPSLVMSWGSCVDLIYIRLAT